MLKHFSTLQIALAVSVGAHAALLGVRFVDPEGFDRVFEDTPLEVILVNARSKQAPVKAQAIAQAQLAGGGGVERGRATSPLPPSATIELGDAAEESQRRIEHLQETQMQWLASVRRELAAMPAPDPNRPARSVEERAREEQRRQRLQLLAEIEKRIQEENARPKKRYISPATQEQAYAIYYDALRRKIEERGTRNFPEYRGRRLYGELLMVLTVDAAGRVVETEVVKPSNSKLLDRRAIAIVKAAAPFGAFTSAMRREADQLVIASRFKFHGEGLETTLSATPGRE
ncbi:energy transducer TonB [Piscinibacter sp.]|uniref:energy transducer TonB n=1 Tax=Piscinibacter sp. TaxID=1903157 RepID=UPI002CE34794|nr:TonB family protein [Albitalea sp.]HUG24621.1 TonB family protein [Albitalea sp.]